MCKMELKSKSLFLFFLLWFLLYFDLLNLFFTHLLLIHALNFNFQLKKICLKLANIWNFLAISNNLVHNIPCILFKQHLACEPWYFVSSVDLPLLELLNVPNVLAFFSNLPSQTVHSHFHFALQEVSDRLQAIVLPILALSSVMKEHRLP